MSYPGRACAALGCELRHPAADRTRYRLSEGYFKAKLPDQARSLYGHDLGDSSPAKRRRISLHLPDDFSSLPLTKREDILAWVRRVIISGSTEYRRYQASQQAALRHRLSWCHLWWRLAGVQSRSSAFGANQNVAADLDESDLLSGVVDAPPRLA